MKTCFIFAKVYERIIQILVNMETFEGKSANARANCEQNLKNLALRLIYHK
jgi:hypothetical protein